MSATCQSPVTTRLIARPGASSIWSGVVGAVIEMLSERQKGALSRAPFFTSTVWRSIPHLRLDRVDIRRRHLADRGHFTVGDLPQAEGTGDVAVLVEGDRTDDTFILDRLAVLDQLQRLGELVLAGMDDRALRVQDLADRILDRGGIRLAGLGDGEADDGAGVIA